MCTPNIACKAAQRLVSHLKLCTLPENTAEIFTVPVVLTATSYAGEPHDSYIRYCIHILILCVHQ